MNEIEKILWYSWLNRFLYTSKSLFKSAKNYKTIFLIELSINTEQITFLENNFNDFIKILENVLNSFNKVYNWKAFKNITINKVFIWENLLNNCLILYNSKKEDKWFIYSKNIIRIPEKKENNQNTEDNIFDKIINLILNKNLSVRNLIKLWIPQIRARELFNFFKINRIFEISKTNNNYKIYNLSEIKKISKKDIETILYRGCV